MAQTLAIGGGDAARRNARHRRHHRLDVGDLDDGAGALVDAEDRPDLVDDVDGLVRQLAEIDVPGRELGRRP